MEFEFRLFILISIFLEDLNLSSAFPKERYERVRYEDLVSDPVKTILDLYFYLGIPIHSQMLDDVVKHFNAETVHTKKRYKEQESL